MKDVECVMMKKVADGVGMNIFYQGMVVAIINMNAKKFVKRQI